MPSQPPGPRYTRQWSVSGPLTRIIILVKAVRAGGVLAAYLIAPPPVLVELGGPPWMLVPRAFKFAELGDAFMSGYQLLLLGTWLLWGGVVFQAVAAVRDIQRELRHADAVLASGRWGRRPGVRNLIASLILAPLSAPVPAMASTHGTTVMLAPVDPTAGTVQGDAADAQAEPRQAAPTHQEVRVQAWGSTATLWGLAEEHLGEGTRWREIWALNEGRQQADGTVMRSPGLLVPGWTVLVPEPSGEATAEPLRYSIEEGDRLGDIAVRFLGDFDDHRRLQQLNADLISDPDHIEAGDTIILPAGTRDAGKTDHAHGKVRNFGRKATSDDDQNPEPPSPVEPADTTEPTVPPTASLNPMPTPSPRTKTTTSTRTSPRGQSQLPLQLLQDFWLCRSVDADGEEHVTIPRPPKRSRTMSTWMTKRPLSSAIWTKNSMDAVIRTPRSIELGSSSISPPHSSARERRHRSHTSSRLFGKENVRWW